MESHRADALLTEAMQQLVAARQRVADLEAFIRVYQELRRSASHVRAASVLYSQPELSEPAEVPPLATGAIAAFAAAQRPAVVLADPDLSIGEAAAKVLRHFGYPLKARRIAATMLAWGFPYPKGEDDLRASVGGILARAVREGDTFVKLSTGLFGLAEWGSTEVEELVDEVGNRSEGIATSLIDEGPLFAGAGGMDLG